MLVEAQAARHARDTAVVCDHDRSLGASSLSYAELNARANQLAHALRAAGAGPGQVVALLVERSFAMVIAILGILKAGAAYLPIAPGHPPARIAFLLQDAGARLLLVHGKTEGKIEFGGRVLNLDDAGLYQGGTDNLPALGSPEDLAYVIYTSGSTGRPKGVMIEHRALVNRLHWMQRAYPIGPGDVILQKTPYTFDVSVWELLWWAQQGATLCLLRPGGEWNPAAIVDAIQRHRVSVMHFVPSMLSVFLEYLDGNAARVPASLGSVRQVFASGEALTPAHVRRFNEAWRGKTGALLANLYGPTEAAIDVTYFDCPPVRDIDAVPIGRPIDNVRLYVLREGRQVAIGEAGDLCIAGAGLARGYLNNAALSAEKFTDNPVRPGERIYWTGDLARWRHDGNLEYLGREDQQVKIRGLRIELGEIENTIRGYPGIVECAVAVRQHSESVAVIVAYAVCRASVEVDALRAFLKRQLPDYMVPHRFEILDELPLTSSGKVDRKALPELEPSR